MRKKRNEVSLAALNRKTNTKRHFDRKPVVAPLLFACHQQVVRVRIVLALVELSKIIIIMPTCSEPT